MYISVCISDALVISILSSIVHVSVHHASEVLASSGNTPHASAAVR